MRKIFIRRTSNGLVFSKGRGQFTIPLVIPGEQECKGPKKNYCVDQKIAKKIQPGVTRIRYRERTGTVARYVLIMSPNRLMTSRIKRK